MQGLIPGLTGTRRAFRLNSTVMGITSSFWLWIAGWGFFSVAFQGGGCLVKKCHAFANFRDRIIPVVFVFNGENSFEPLAVQFGQHLLGVALAGTPGHIVAEAGVAFADLVDVFEV